MNPLIHRHGAAAVVPCTVVVKSKPTLSVGTGFKQEVVTGPVNNRIVSIIRLIDPCPDGELVRSV